MKNDEMDRIIKYMEMIDAFLNNLANKEFREIFREFHTTLVCDDIGLSGAQQVTFDTYVRDGKLTYINWSTFLLRTKQMYKAFLDEAEKQKRNVSEAAE